MVRRSEPVSLAWIEQNSTKIPETGCWVWNCYVDKLGYARTFCNGRNERVHRLALSFSIGGIPAGKQANHHCDVRCCVNPDHLYVGDKLSNAQDMVKRGRHGTVNPEVRAKISATKKGRFCGDEGSNTKLYSWVKTELKALRAAGASVKELAAKYSVHPDYLKVVIKTF
jgi:hypothetical protein